MGTLPVAIETTPKEGGSNPSLVRERKGAAVARRTLGLRGHSSTE